MHFDYEHNFMVNHAQPSQDARQGKMIHGILHAMGYNAPTRPYKPRHGVFRGYLMQGYRPGEKPLRRAGNSLRIDYPCKAVEWRTRAVSMWQW